MTAPTEVAGQFSNASKSFNAKSAHLKIFATKFLAQDYATVVHLF